MIDVMTKLKEIVESGYESEDVQRGIEAAAKTQPETTVIETEEEAVEEFVEAAADEVIDEAEVAEEEVEEDAVEEVHEDVEEDTSLADMLKLAGRSGVMGLSQNNIIAESLELDEEDDLEEAYINTSNDAIDTLGELRKIGKSIERGQGEYEGNLANKYANDVYDVISWVENNLDTNEPNYQKVLGPVIELRKKAKGMERELGSDKDARFGNQIVNTLYPLMQWIEMNAHGSGVKEVEEEVELEEGGSGDAPISKMSRAELIDYLGTTDAEVANMSDDELRDAANEKTMDMQSVDNNQPAVEETVEVPVQALEELLQLAGYTDYKSKVEEYSNEPEEAVADTETQLIGLSGGLNRPKKQFAKAQDGDNAMAVEANETNESQETAIESFYKKYDEFVQSLNKQD